MTSSPVHATPTQEPTTDSIAPHSQPLALPATASNDLAQLLDVSRGTTVKLDHLGPMVVNQDGSLSRISNWDKMTDMEQRNTLRVISKRNQQRLAALRQVDETAKSKVH